MIDLLDRAGLDAIFNLDRYGTDMDSDDTYDLYTLASPGGALLRHQALRYASDDYAIAHAMTLAGRERIELWKDGVRLLAVSGDYEPAQVSLAPRA